MANATNYFGLRPVKRLGGGQLVTIPCYVAATYATALFIGDPVTLSDAAADRDATGTMLSVEKSGVADTSAIFGVISGMDPLVTDLTKQYNPASTERIVHVTLATQDTVFEVRGNGVAAPTKLTPGLNAILAQAANGSTVWGTSGIALDEGTDAPAADQSNPLLILNIKNVADNELGVNAVYEVLVNTPNATGTYLGVAGA
jgi:hypothetical protein